MTTQATPTAAEREQVLRLELVKAGRELDRRGWVMGTSGNLSARLDGPEFVITASGRHKGRLTVDDFVVPGRAGERNRPSAETSIHEAIYRSVPAAQAILHAHTVATTAASLLTPKRPDPAVLDIPDLEMIKGFDVWDAEDGISLLVLPNFPDVSAIARMLEPMLADLEAPTFLIYGHGGTVWGRSVEEAQNRLEVLDFLCDVALRAM
jgi:methylthioribulose-1-phosphate dehydratase